MRNCKTCANYSDSCDWNISKERRKQIIEDYEFDCYTTQEQKELCDMMCGNIEE